MYLIILFLVINNTSEVNNMNEIIAALLFSVQRKASTIRVPSLVPRPEGENFYYSSAVFLPFLLCFALRLKTIVMPIRIFCDILGECEPESGLDI